jgi:putative addiction module killer protein
MLEVERTPEYASWALSLQDDRAKAKIALRIDRLMLGNPGVTRSVGGGVVEMKIDYGPGYRVYFGKHGSKVVIILCGGTKKGQSVDIERAKRIFDAWKKTR